MNLQFQISIISLLLIQNLIADSITRIQTPEVPKFDTMNTGDTQPPDKSNLLSGANPNISPKQAETQLLGVTQIEPMNVTETPSVDLLEKGDAEMSSEAETVTKEDRNAAAKAQAKRLKAQIEHRAKETPDKSVTPEKESIASRTRLQSRAQTESPIKAPMLTNTQDLFHRAIHVHSVA